MDKLLTTRELAQFLGINEKKVYALIEEEALPASKVAGKWLFALDLVRSWLAARTVNVPAGRQAAASGLCSDVLVLAGSNDVLLDRAMALFMERHPGLLAAFANLGSMGGLRALGRGLCHAATSHLLQDGAGPEGGEFNFAFAAEVLTEDPVVVNFCRREQGFLLPAGNPDGVRGIEDIWERRLAVANRAPGTGTRLLFDKELARIGADPSQLPGYERIVSRHLDAGLEVLSGRARAAPGIRAVAGLLGLAFAPVRWERFDLLATRERYFEKPVQLYLNLLHEPAFRSLADGLEGYDLSLSGRTVFPAVSTA